MNYKELTKDMNEFYKNHKEDIFEKFDCTAEEEKAICMLYGAMAQAIKEIRGL